MHVNNTNAPEVFRPVTITVVLETPEELRGFGTICNYTPFTDSARKVGIDLTSIFDSLPEGAYDAMTWDEDVASLATTLANHPALDTPTTSDDVTPEPIVEEFLGQAIDELLDVEEDEVTEVVAPPAVPVSKSSVTCEVTDINGYEGIILVSDGRSYTYSLEGCGEAIRVKTTDGAIITEVPTSKYNTSELQPADIEVLEAVFSQIS